ncbi:MAG: hypothetical protein RBT63_00290 [Bdellovibrionales bacterium]|jgi:hypothetical protein|nr:hypothetical protein [Bdellovibrionales bacterium]
MSLIRAIAVVLVFQIGFGLPYTAYAGTTQSNNAHVASKPRTNKLTYVDYAAPVIERMRLNPVFDQFAQSPMLPEFTVNRSDSAVDQDPFFLRSQKWAKLHSRADVVDPSFTVIDTQSIALSLPAAQKSLVLNKPLQPVLFTDEYVIMTAQEGSTFLEEASGKLTEGQYATQGLFFINYGEWLTAAKNNLPTHVFFFPLPGDGWKGQIEIEELADLDVLSLQNRAGNWIPVELGDIRTAEKISRLNSALGSAIALKNPQVKERIGHQYAQLSAAALKQQDVGAATVLAKLSSEITKAALPARGSTYAFGLVATGFDLDTGRSFSLKSLKDLEIFKSPLFQSLANLVGVKKANADIGIGPELWERIERFLIPFGGMFVTAIGLKYTILKEQFKFRRAALDIRNMNSLAFNQDHVIRALYDAGVKSRTDLATANAEELTRLAAEKFSAHGSGATGVKSLSTDYVRGLISEADQSVKAVKESQPNWLTRKIPENVRAEIKADLAALNSRIPTPIKTATRTSYRETVEIFDTFASVLSFAKSLPTVVSGLTIQRLADRYIPEMSAADSRLLNKVMENTFLWAKRTNSNIPVNTKTFMLGAIWMGTIDTGSAAIQLLYTNPMLAEAIAPHLPPSLEQKVYESFSSGNVETRQLIVNEIVRNGIAWLSVGASSYSQETQAQLEPILRKEAEEALKRAGKNLENPKVKEELEGLVRDAMNVRLRDMGIPDNIYFQFDVNTVDKTVLRALGLNISKEANQKAFDGERLTLAAEQRPALIKSALVKAIALMRADLAKDPSADKTEALRILEDARQKISWLRFNPLKPVESWRQMREVNSMLALLSYTGEVDAAVRVVPELWHNMNPEGARLAAVRMRQAFFYYYTADGHLLALPPDFVKTNIAEAKAFAEKTLIEKYSPRDFFAKRMIEQGETELANRFNTTQLTRQEVFERYKGEYALTVEQFLREKMAAETREAQIENYKHPKLGWYEERQHRRIYRNAADKFNIESLQSTANVPDDRFQRLYAEAYAKEMAIHPNAANESEQRVLDTVLVRAFAETLSELKQPELARYLEKLDQTERTKIELWTLGKNYVSIYKLAMVDQRMVPARSPLQPGFTQRLRQTNYLRQSGVIPGLSRFFLRGFDSLFDDESSHRSGLKAKVDRNIPLAWDTWFANTRNLKSIVPAATVGWLWLGYFWGVNFAFVTYLFAVSLNPLIMIPSQWLNRAFRQQGWEPMGGLFSKTVYGLPYAWVTFAGSIPWVMYNADVVQGFSRMITGIGAHPISQAIGHAAATAAPFLPALLAVPLIAELVESVRNRRAVAKAETTLRGPPSAQTKGAAGGASCSALFTPK